MKLRIPRQVAEAKHEYLKFTELHGGGDVK